MAYKRIVGPLALSSIPTDLYTVPEGRRTRIRHIRAQSPGGADVAVRVRSLSDTALLFTNAATDHVDHGSAAVLDNINAGSLLAWVYRTATTSDRILYMKGNAAELSRAKYLKVNSSDNGQGAGSLQFGMYRATTPLLVEPTGTPVTQDAWVCIAATFDADGSASDQHIYIGDLDEVLTEPGAYTVRQAGSGTPSDEAADDFHIGNEVQVAPLRLAFPGRIAMFAYWNRVLTLAELRAQQYAPSVTPGCVLFAELSGSSVPDLSGNGNTGTVSGATDADGITPLAILEESTPINIRRRAEFTLREGERIQAYASETDAVLVIDGYEEAV